MGIGGMGSWRVESKTDPRWNKEGLGFGAVISGGPKEMRDWIKECEAKYGEAPDDATMSFYKY